MTSYQSYALIAAIAAVATYLFTFPTKVLAVRFGAVDQPGEHRVHSRPTPVVGGAAMFAAFVVAMAVASRMGVFGSIFRDSSEPLGVVAAGLVIYLVGLIDDVRDISAPAKVAGQVLAAMVLVFLGVTMYYFKVPFVAGIDVLSPSVLPLITALWVVGIANAVNLIDGLDGLAAGVVGIGSLSLCIYGLRLVHQGDLDATNLGPLLAAITFGICVGFLPHNFHPARIFMGDGGAMFLGLLMASATMIIGGRTENPNLAVGGPADVSGLEFFRFAPLFIPFFILGVPLLDTVFAIVRRTARRSSFAERDLGHLHHRLVRLGHGQRRAVLILWAWTAVLSAFVLLPSFDSHANAIVPVGIGVLVVALYTVFRPGTRPVDATPSIGRARSPLGDASPARLGTAGSIPVIVSGAAGIAVAGEPDLASPKRRTRVRPSIPRFMHLRRPADPRSEDPAPVRVAGRDDEVRG